MKVAVLIDRDQQFRIHAEGCADVAKEAKRFHDTPWVFEAEDRHAVNLACWGDIASDSTESGTPQWEKACDEYATSETTFLPCVKNLPEIKEKTAMTRVILVKPGEKPVWVQLPPAFELGERTRVILGCLDDESFESAGSGNGWVAYVGSNAKFHGKPVNTGYLPLFRSIGGQPSDLVAGPVLLCGVSNHGDETAPPEELRAVFGDLWPEDAH
jgi:hypothetical protein